MMYQPDPVRSVLERADGYGAEEEDAPEGSVAHLVQTYKSDGYNLLGYVLEMSYDQATIVTCDAWKRKCGGVPKNSFVVIRLNPAAAGLPAGGATRPSLILARVIQAAGTPLSSEVQQTIFAIHKVQAAIDPYTNADLQWGALEVAILGTYYDDAGQVAFGNDIDSYMSPHFYEVYVPPASDLNLLINSFVRYASATLPNTLDLAIFVEAHGDRYRYDETSSTLSTSGMMTETEYASLLSSFIQMGEAKREIERLYRRSQHVPIGSLRYTETQTLDQHDLVPIMVAPADFIANRTALFGKTRMGKSNTVKIIADMIMRSREKVGQVIFDLNGEYAYYNEQDGTSLYELHRERCTRYSLNSRRKPEPGVPRPRTLKVNFFQQVELGHSIIAALFDSSWQSRPGYIVPLLVEWEPCDDQDVADRFPDKGDATRYLRAQSMYFAVLEKAGFKPDMNITVDLHLHKPIRQRLASDPGLVSSCVLDPPKPGEPASLADRQPLTVATRIYERLYALYTASRMDTTTLFPVSKNSGKPYFEPIHECLLRLIGDPGVLGARYLTPFIDYHDAAGSNVVKDIVLEVDAGRSVIIDLSNADEVVAGYYSELVSREVFKRQATKFTTGELGDHSVLFFFEEAHNLFSKDDKNLRSIYNRLAKEGAKYRIGLVYLTQSMTTLSPDLLKNTENLFVAHLNDDREVHELTRRYEFRDVGLDVQRCKTQGYVRMITLSHRYALPVQIRKFGKAG